MSTQDQQELKEKYYSEAMRYMDNAKECLKKAKKEDGYFSDQKYVRMACGTAYSGVLIALDCFLILKGVHKPTAKERKSIEYYQKSITKIDQKMLNGLNTAYKILHLWGYYDGIEKITVVKDGFDEAYKIIEKVKPTIE
jgi:tetratricopeptide (TPR) repeat protein